MVNTRIVESLCSSQPDDSITIQGWVRTKRELKEFAFIEVNDGSCLTSLQVILDTSLSNYEEVLKQLNTGASVKIDGVVVTSQGKGQRIELKACSVKVLGGADPQTYPLQKKRHSFEFLRTIGHLRPRTNSFGAVFRVRNACSMAIHQFFQERGFIWVHTPIITASDCEGAGELFHVSSLNTKTISCVNSQAGEYTQEFFGRPTYLTVSGQLEAEIMAMALTNIYTFGPTFRAEKSNTSRHLAEFWMIEPEMAFYNLQENIDLAETFLRHIFQYVTNKCLEDMEFFNKRIDNTVLATAENIINNQSERISYTEAIKLLEKANVKFEYPVVWGLDLQSEHERYLCEQIFKKLVIVTDYPAEIKAFYMRLNDDNKTVAAMDILAPKIGEIIGGSQREERLDILEKRLISQEIQPEKLWWYLDLRRFGTAPHAGFGLGFERLIQFMTGMSNIRDVIPFPRTPENVEF
ncbi:Asparaginyl-tRNA synthetase [Richelia intracellularis HM01]|uniref:asparagine--tRNA ligase n=1 Tax=Richelia intracellularis TaxID=1164990 RepID=UPI0002B544E4|nr:asparagine--tRNA ligase [Richelia intracellularis]CCH65847.1 Asparaginyl-tRNA synthetase [Richelia intracellularis HM01]